MFNPHPSILIVLFALSTPTQASTPSPSVCFSPDDRCDERITQWLDGAQRTLDVAAYDLTLDSFAHHLLVKSRTIPVRLIVDRRQAHGEHSLVPMLIKASKDANLRLKLEVRFGRQRGIMHHKFVLLDRKKLETGSFNYTNNASKNNQENQVYMDAPQIVSRYADQFDRMWKSAKPAKLILR